MNSFRTFALATVAVATAGEAMQYRAPIDPAWAPAMAPRDNCPALPALCTGPAMLQGTAMTLTYLCPATTDAGAVSTVHVTVTQTTTVTAGPDNSGIAPSKGAPAPVPAPAEPTTTTTVHSTATQYKTLTVTRKKDTASAVPAPEPTIKPSSSQVTSSTSSFFITPVTPSSKFISTSGFTFLPPFSSAPVSSTATDTPGPCTDCNFSWLQPAPHIPVPTNHTTSATSPIQTASGTGAFSVLPISLNATSMPGYSFPTIHVRAAESAKPSKTGGAGQKSVAFGGVFLGLMAAVYFA